MAKRVAMWVGLVAALAMASAGTPGRAQAAGAVVETRHLLASDATGRLQDGQLQALAEQAQATLDRLLELWGCPAQTETFGKILLIYDEPFHGHCTSTCFVGRKEGGRAGGESTRTVRVFGCAEAPLMLAHKFTAALMPQPDKLLRNLMGAISEMHLGNPRSFPACGQDVDDWVRSFARSGTLVPLDQLGPDHESWGMRDQGGGRLMAFDRVRQQRAYAETASFARYLEAAHGLEGLKRLTRLSRAQARPWKEALGAELADLEGRWLESLKEGGMGREEQVGRLARVMGSGFGDPCAQAQRAVPGLRR